MPDRNSDRHDIERYLRLPYAIELRQYEDDGTWFAAMPELPGCMTEADTAEEALTMIRDAQRVWLEAALEAGRHIPEPEPPVVYSGHLRVTMAQALHRKLAGRASRERTSINDFVVSLIRRAVEGPAQEGARPRRRREPAKPTQPLEVREP